VARHAKSQAKRSTAAGNVYEGRGNKRPLLCRAFGLSARAACDLRSGGPVVAGAGGTPLLSGSMSLL